MRRPDPQRNDGIALPELPVDESDRRVILQQERCDYVPGGRGGDPLQFASLRLLRGADSQQSQLTKHAQIVAIKPSARQSVHH